MRLFPVRKSYESSLTRLFSVCCPGAVPDQKAPLGSWFARSRACRDFQPTQSCSTFRGAFRQFVLTGLCCVALLLSFCFRLLLYYFHPRPPALCVITVVAVLSEPTSGSGFSFPFPCKSVTDICLLINVNPGTGARMPFLILTFVQHMGCVAHVMVRQDVMCG